MKSRVKGFRLGNYVQDDTNFVWTIGGVYDKLIYSHGEWREAEAFKDIPISELALLNLGFVYDKEDDLYVYGIRKRIGVRLLPDEAIVYYSRDIGIDFYGIDFVDTVHRLQNICHALLEEDLTLHTIKL
jgi:hypothetical protein